MAPITRTTRSRLALLLAIPVLSAAAMYLVAAEAREGNELVDHTLRVELSLERLISDLELAETKQRSYLLTNEKSYLDTYQAALAQVRRELANVRALTADNARQQDRLAQLRTLVDSRLAHLQETIGLHGAAPLEPREVERIDRGGAIMDSLRKVIDGMFQEEEGLLAQREQQLSKVTRNFLWALAVGYLLIVLLVVSLYHGVQRFSRQSADAEQKLSRLNADLERRVEERTSRLQANEELLRTFVKYVPAAVAMLDRDMRYLQVSDRWCDDYALDGSRILGCSHYDIFPDLPERWKQIHRRVLAGETVQSEEDYWERAGSAPTWLRWKVRPWGGHDGRPQGILIFTEDITARKRIEATLRESEAALRALAGSLLTAQEDERRRVARDLHDSVTQRLALLSIDMGKMAAAELGPEEDTRARLHTFQRQLLQTSHEVRRLSHGLHPSVIEDFGLSVALEEYCEEFEKSHAVRVPFDGAVDDSGLSADAASCLYRIAQEGIWNALRHGQASEVRVSLSAANGWMELRVKDNGRGFSPDVPGGRTGLGLVSMKERIKLVSGLFSLTTCPGQGTEILSSVPLQGGVREDAHHPVG